MDQKYNRIMPQSEGNVVCLEIADRVTLKTYETVFEPPVHKMIEETGAANILLYYSGPFPGWDIDAAAHDLESMTKLGRFIKKVALVNPSEQIMVRWQTLKPLISGQIKFFSSEELNTALAWIKS